MSALGADIVFVVVGYDRYEGFMAVPDPTAGYAGSAVTARTAVRAGHSTLSAACTRRQGQRHQLYAMRALTLNMNLMISVGK